MVDSEIELLEGVWAAEPLDSCNDTVWFQQLVGNKQISLFISKNNCTRSGDVLIQLEFLFKQLKS